MKIFIKVKAARRQLLNVIADDGTIFAITILIFMTISNIINNSEQDSKRQKNLLWNSFIIADVINTQIFCFVVCLTDKYCDYQNVNVA